MLDEFFRTGTYRVRTAAETHETSSPSMDISKASNFERFVFDLLGRDAARTRELFRSGTFTITPDEFALRSFAKILQVLKGGGGPDAAFRAYLYTTVRRVAYDRTRSNSRVQVTDDLYDNLGGIIELPVTDAQWARRAAPLQIVTPLPDIGGPLLWSEGPGPWIEATSRSFRLEGTKGATATSTSCGRTSAAGTTTTSPRCAAALRPSPATPRSAPSTRTGP